MRMKLYLAVFLILVLTACDSNFEFKVGESNEVNQICLTNIFGGDEKFWDLSYIEKDCRKGEIVTTSVFLQYASVAEDVSFYERRLNYLISKICDFDKQIIIQKFPVTPRDDMHIYDLSCVYSGGFNFGGRKWIEEMNNNSE